MSLLAHKTVTVLRALKSWRYNIFDSCLWLAIKNLFRLTGFVCFRGSINPLLLPSWIRLDAF